MSTPIGSKQAGSRDERAYFRVQTHLPLRCRPLAPNEVERVAAAITSSGEEGNEKIDPALAVWLARLEAKIDRILIFFEVPDADGFSPYFARSVVLSGSGMRFARKGEEAELQGHVLIEFELPGKPPHTVRCIGHTLGAEREVDQTDLEGESVAVEFEAIRESDRDAIVQHTLDVQRVELRKKRSSA